MNREEEQILFGKIKTGDEKAFEAVFRHFYPHLCLYATSVLKNDSAAEEIVQELFAKLWEKRKMLQIESSLKNYLFRSVRNHCLNYLKHDKIKNFYARKMAAESGIQDDNFDVQTELFLQIEKSIAELPEKRQEIFRLNRQDGLKYREIAEKLNISIKTVETQMGLALKTLREKLRDFLAVF